MTDRTVNNSSRKRPSDRQTVRNSPKYFIYNSILISTEINVPEIPKMNADNK